MKKIGSYCLLLLSMAVSAFATNPDGVYLGDPSYGGTGCPTGTASVSLSPDASSMSILFDRYVVEAGDYMPAMGRKSCNLAVPVHVPAGFSVSVFKIDYRGFNSLLPGANSTFRVEYFFAGTRGPQFQKTFYGPLQSDYLLSNTLQATANTWSACGQDVILRVNSSMLVNSRMGYSSSTVDSIDVDSGMIYHFAWRTCR